MQGKQSSCLLLLRCFGLLGLLLGLQLDLGHVNERSCRCALEALWVTNPRGIWGSTEVPDIHVTLLAAPGKVDGLALELHGLLTVATVEIRADNGLITPAHLHLFLMHHQALEMECGWLDQQHTCANPARGWAPLATITMIVINLAIDAIAVLGVHVEDVVCGAAEGEVCVHPYEFLELSQLEDHKLLEVKLVAYANLARPIQEVGLVEPDELEIWIFFENLWVLQVFGIRDDHKRVFGSDIPEILRHIGDTCGLRVAWAQWHRLLWLALLFAFGFSFLDQRESGSDLLASTQVN